MTKPPNPTLVKVLFGALVGAVVIKTVTSSKASSLAATATAATKPPNQRGTYGPK